MLVTLTLYGKPGCHLCDDAREVIEAVRSECAGLGIESVLQEQNILEDPGLARLHAEEIPVLLINGRRHAIWRVDHDRLSVALKKAAKRPLLARLKGTP